MCVYIYIYISFCILGVLHEGEITYAAYVCGDSFARANLSFALSTLSLALAYSDDIPNNLDLK